MHDTYAYNSHFWESANPLVEALNHLAEELNSEKSRI